jgi:uncharacterized OB-fold protein
MRICEKCGESFVPRDKKETVCLFCQGLAGEYTSNRIELDRIVTAYTRVFDDDGSIDRGSGLSGKHIPGKARHECEGFRSSYRYQKKNCKICSKVFYPTGPADNLCDKCKPSKAETKEKIRIKNLEYRLRRGEISLKYFQLKIIPYVIVTRHKRK